MRYLFILIFLGFCNESFCQENKVVDTAVSTITTMQNNIDSCCYQTVPFQLVKNYPVISDTAYFIKQLIENCHLYDREQEVTINYFKKTKIYGSDKMYYIIECHDWSSPHKYQYIFDEMGKLISILSSIRIDIVKIFPRENPFLICVSSTGHGNGWHEILRIRKDTIENVYDGFLGNRPQTYDANEDISINEPIEFPYKIIDINHDGFNDIVFSGKIVLIEGCNADGKWFEGVLPKKGEKIISYSIDNPYKKIPVIFKFLYNPKTEHFTEQEDYSKKYEYIFGNTKY